MPISKVLLMKMRPQSCSKKYSVYKKTIQSRQLPNYHNKQLKIVYRKLLLSFILDILSKLDILDINVTRSYQCIYILHVWQFKIITYLGTHYTDWLEEVKWRKRNFHGMFLLQNFFTVWVSELNFMISVLAWKELLPFRFMHHCNFMTRAKKYTLFFRWEMLQKFVLF